MTHIETARVNELLRMQITVVREYAERLDPQDLEQLEERIVELEGTIGGLKELLASLPHQHAR